MALNTSSPISGSDLDRLESRHRDEERREAHRDLVVTPRPLALRLPEGGHLPESEAWLERLYAAGIVREKKPAVFDHLRSQGPWFVSVDTRPLSVLDGMSQTATVPAGFAADGMPLAVQIVGRPGDEATLLSLAAQMEAERPWADKRPPIS